MDTDSETQAPKTSRTWKAWATALLLSAAIFIAYILFAGTLASPEGLMTLLVALGVLGLGVADADSLYNPENASRSKKDFLRLFANAFAIAGSFGAIIVTFVNSICG